MILRTLKSNGPLNYILFLIIGILFWFVSLRFPFSYNYFEGENKSILFTLFDKITDGYPFIQVLLSLVLMLLTAFLIQQINSRYSLVKARTKLPIAVYIIIVGGITSMHTLHPVYFAAIFTLIGIHSLFSIFNNPNPQLDLFNAGLFLAIGTLFYFNLIVVLPAFLISISSLRRERNLSEYIILVIGFIIPLLFALTFVFFTDQLNDAFLSLKNNILTPVNHFKANYPLQGFIGILVILTIIASVKMMQQYDSRKVSIRKYYLVLLIIFLFTTFSFVFLPATSQEMLVIGVIPLTFLITNLFTSIESGFWRELLFALLLGSAIFMQFADKLIPQ